MHLPELPTIFVKNGEERKVYFSVQARELLAAGWEEKNRVQKAKPEEKRARASSSAVKAPLHEEKPQPSKKEVEPKAEVMKTGKE